MAKFLVLFKASASASEMMAQATKEEIQASMQAWTDWKDALDSTIGFEWGLPLRAAGEVSRGKIGSSASTVSGYATMEGDKDAILKVLTTHPHQTREGTSIDLMEMIPLADM